MLHICKSLLIEAIAIVKSLLIEVVAIVRERFLLWIVLGLVILAGTIALHPYDATLTARCAAVHNGTTYRIADNLSKWGNYPRGTLIICATVLIAGLAFRCKTCQTAAIACFMGATLAGLEADVPKLLLGRARPNSGLQDGFYGPKWRNGKPDRNFESFPSGHATTSSATAVALAVALPPVGVPALVGAAGVMWSRVCLGVHYPTDVWVGGWIGALNGLVFGWAARRLRAKAGNKPAT